MPKSLWQVVTSHPTQPVRSMTYPQAPHVMSARGLRTSVEHRDIPPWLSTCTSARGSICVFTVSDHA